ncbi:hypothetical protein BJV77DRAFT_184490 [Russula vinacea]|nr:hypothetical protein BJV77DRAFT_184490 [Russula vinacea]
MAGDLVLQYLVEGGHQLSEISITDDWPVTIDGLMDIIFMEHRSVAKLAPNHKHLTLLKINVDPDHAGRPLPLLRFKGNDKGVEKLPPSKLIHDIWPELPPVHRIHFFVTYTGLSEVNEERRDKLEAALLICCTFWGKNLDDVLAVQPVTNYGNFKYLTEKQILSLKLERLLYNEVVLLVREEYNVCYKDLKDAYSVAQETKVVVV